MPEIGRQDGQAPLGIFALAIPAQQSLDRKSVTEMPNAAFPSECRVRENTESRPDALSEGSGRQAPGDIFGSRDSALFPYSVGTSIAQSGTRGAYRLAGNEPAYR